MYVLQFKYSDPEDVRNALRSLSAAATLKESSDFFLFTELPGQAPFKLDCELVKVGLFADDSGAYENFRGLLLRTLSAKFGEVKK